MKSRIEIANDLSVSIIDTLSASVCLVDETGEIVAVNESWCRFADENPPIPLNYGIGVNYLNLKIDDRVLPVGDTSSADLNKIIEGIKGVLNGSSKEYTFEYPCHSPEKERWFIGRVRRFINEGKTFLVISHEDITRRVLAEGKLRGSFDLLLKSRYEFAHLVESIPVGVYTLSTRPGGQMQFNYLSRKLIDLLQIDEKEVLSDPVAAFRSFHPDDIIGLRELNFKRINDPAYFEWTGRILLDGQIKWLHMASTPELQADGSTLWQGVVSDITGRKLAEEKISSLLSEKELLLQEVHHRIKNNMSSIIGLLAMQEDTLKDPVAKDALQDTASRIRSMLVLYDKLYRSENFDTVSVKDYLSQLIDDIIGHFAITVPVSIEKNMIDFLFDIKRIQPLGIIVNEVLTNIMKYAFTGRDNGHIWINLNRCNDMICLEIIDDGVGMPESVNFENSPGFGLLLINILSQQMKGDIGISRENGTKITLKFPTDF